LAGDSSAAPARTFDDLYRSEYTSAVRLAYLLVSDSGRAEELVQDAFVRTLPRLESLENPAGYLRSTVLNLCRDEHRRRARAGRHRQLSVAYSPPPRLPTTESAVWMAMQKLPQRQREALVLRYYLDWDSAAISAALGARPGTVRSLIHRGLSTLQKEVPRD
jgi:RNA polymerase sigma factor (sigma-70 family)